MSHDKVFIIHCDHYFMANSSELSGQTSNTLKIL